MRIIGLTGSIACGKSTVSGFLASRGYPVIDGDRISRELTSPRSPVLPELRRAFGDEILYEDGTLNRRRLSRIVFSDASARAVLDELMAPFLMNRTRQYIDQAYRSGAPLCFLDMPLLFEKGYDRLCDTVWTVWLPEKKQLERLIARDGYTCDEAIQRIRAVLSSDEKAARADAVIDNSGSVQQTFAVVSDLLAAEMSAINHNSTAQTAAVPAGVHSPGGDAVHVAPPQSMDRPVYASVKRKNRKSGWRMPFWLKTALISAASFILISVTALLLMNAYLHSCSQRHIDEQNAIGKAYPLLYRELIERYADEYNLSPAFVSAVISNESSFKVRNESGVGARGLMQLMPDTAEWIAGKLRLEGYSFERMYDAETNIRFGCWYLNYLSKLYLGDPVSVTAAYHAGQGQVKVWLSDPSRSEDGYSIRIESLPEGPTKHYVGKVLRDYGIYKKKYFSDDLLSAVSADVLHHFTGCSF